MELRRAGRAQRGGRHRIARVSLTAAMAVVALNIWTGSPLLALWIGSQVQGAGPPTMGAIAVVVVSMLAFSLGLVALLNHLGRLHDRLVGFTPTVTDHAPWLRSMRGERPLYPGVDAELSVLERVLIAMVATVVVVFELWLLLFSGSPVDQRSGRDGCETPIVCR
ncbi:MAG: hypothetical protein GXY03_14815 [Solirubrobacterales bacterium]|nr:hypothetical protein [Solirubrobacterales bacterium]